VFVLLLTGCTENQRLDVENTEFDYQMNLLPLIIDETNFINVGNGEPLPLDAENSEIVERCLTIGDELVSDNGINFAHPFGSFILDGDLSVIGFSFNPVALSELDFLNLGNVGLVPEMPSGRIGISSFALYENNRESSGTSLIEVSTLDSLGEIEGLEFLNFDTCSFSPTIWMSLKRLAELGTLKGISVFNSGKFFSHRKNEVIPQLTGVSICVKSIDDIRLVGEAFPNLVYLSLSLDRKLFTELVKNKVLQHESFSDLKALRISNSDFFPPWDYFDHNKNYSLDIQNMKAGHDWIPANLSMFMINSNLLTAKELYFLPDLADFIRLKRPVLDVVSVGYGMLSNDAIRGFSYLEDFAALESVWRTEKEKGPLNGSNVEFKHP
jgi:hypothetical protein